MSTTLKFSQKLMFLQGVSPHFCHLIMFSESSCGVETSNFGEMQGRRLTLTDERPYKIWEPRLHFTNTTWNTIECWKWGETPLPTWGFEKLLRIILLSLEQSTDFGVWLKSQQPELGSWLARMCVLRIAGCSIEGMRMIAQIKLGLWNGYHHETDHQSYVAHIDEHCEIWITSLVEE